MSRDRALAWIAMAATVIIWATFLVSTRIAAVETTLGPVDVGLMRFGTATLLFLPVLLRRGIRPGGATWRDVIMIAGCGGFAFVFLLSTGLQFAPVADSGVFTPSMLPVYVALLSWTLLGERFDRVRLAGFAMIVAGALAVGGWEALHRTSDGAWRGHLLFSAAAISWAAYTVAFRMSGLSALDAAALLCFWSTLGFLALAIVLGTGLADTPPGVIAAQVVLQGVLSGFLATFTFGYAIGQLGPSRAAAFAALVPILAALGGWLALGEALSWVKALGILVVAVGVALASGAASAKRIRQHVAHDP